MRRGKTWLIALWSLIWLICLIDGICRIEKSAFWGMWEAMWPLQPFCIPAAAFAAVPAAAPHGSLFRIYALAELIAVPALMVLWVATWTGSEWFSNAILLLLVAVSTPVPCCTAMIAPLFGWGLLLFGSLALARLVENPLTGLSDKGLAA